VPVCSGWSDRQLVQVGDVSLHALADTVTLGVREPSTPLVRPADLKRDLVERVPAVDVVVRDLDLDRLLVSGELAAHRDVGGDHDPVGVLGLDEVPVRVTQDLDEHLVPLKAGVDPLVGAGGQQDGPDNDVAPVQDEGAQTDIESTRHATLLL